MIWPDRVELGTRGEKIALSPSSKDIQSELTAISPQSRDLPVHMDKIIRYRFDTALESNGL